MSVQRIGYVDVGVLRGQQGPPAMRKGQYRREARHGLPPKGPWRHSTLFFSTWDERRIASQAAVYTPGDR